MHLMIIFLEHFKLRLRRKKEEEEEEKCFLIHQTTIEHY